PRKLTRGKCGSADSICRRGTTRAKVKLKEQPLKLLQLLLETHELDLVAHMPHQSGGSGQKASQSSGRKNHRRDLRPSAAPKGCAVARRWRDRRFARPSRRFCHPGTRTRTRAPFNETVKFVAGWLKDRTGQAHPRGLGGKKSSGRWTCVLS